MTDCPAPPEFRDGDKCELGSLEDEDETDDVDQRSMPRLPSVKDLAAKFQPRLSPEPKPRKSLMKVCLAKSNQLSYQGRLQTKFIPLVPTTKTSKGVP